MGYKIKLKIKENGENSDEEILYHNPNLINSLVNNGAKLPYGRCFNYALGIDDIWYCETAYEYLIENYNRIPISQAKKGDIITYLWKDEDVADILHFARIYKTNGTKTDTTIQSKWGQLGIYRTKIDELPEEYGNYFEVWTKRKVI